MCFNISFRACEIVEALSKSGLSHDEIVAETIKRLSQEFIAPETTIKKAVEWAIL